MKKLFLPVVLVSFTLVSNASETSNTSNFETAFECHRHISVDCDGDGNADYEGTVRCEYGDALRDQFISACR